MGFNSAFKRLISSYVYLNINQLDALNFIMSLFHASTTCARDGHL